MPKKYKRQDVLDALRAAKVRHVLSGSYAMRHVREPKDLDVIYHPDDMNKLKSAIKGLRTRHTDYTKALPLGQGEYDIPTEEGTMELFHTPYSVEGFDYPTLKAEGYDTDEYGNETWTEQQMKRWKKEYARPKDIEDLKLLAAASLMKKSSVMEKQALLGKGKLLEALSNVRNQLKSRDILITHKMKPGQSGVARDAEGFLHGIVSPGGFKVDPKRMPLLSPDEVKHITNRHTKYNRPRFPKNFTPEDKRMKNLMTLVHEKIEATTRRAGLSNPISSHQHPSVLKRESRILRELNKTHPNYVKYKAGQRGMEMGAIVNDTPTMAMIRHDKLPYIPQMFKDLPGLAERADIVERFAPGSQYLFGGKKMPIRKVLMNMRKEDEQFERIMKALDDPLVKSIFGE